jgi:hypothetical protein
MLSFNPDRRISVAEAIQHPYFKNFQHLGAPPTSESKFDWSWDQFELNKELLQRVIYMESLYFHPDPQVSDHPPMPSPLQPLLSNEMRII